MSSVMKPYRWTLTPFEGVLSGASRPTKKTRVSARVDVKAGAIRIRKTWSGTRELCVFVPSESKARGRGAVRGEGAFCCEFDGAVVCAVVLQINRDAAAATTHHINSPDTATTTTDDTSPIHKPTPTHPPPIS